MSQLNKLVISIKDNPSLKLLQFLFNEDVLPFEDNIKYSEAV